MPKLVRKRSSSVASYESFGQALGEADSFEELAGRAARACADVAKADICTIWRVYTEEAGRRRLRLAGSYGIAQPAALAQEVTYAITPGARKYDGVTGFVASRCEAVLVHSFEELHRKYKFCHRGKMDKLQWESKPARRMRNLYAVPLTLGDQLQGVLKVENRRGRHSFREVEVDAVNAIAERLAFALKGLVLLDAHEHRLLEGPASLSTALVDRPFATDQLMQDIVNKTAEALDAQVCSLWLVDEQRENLVHQANYGFRGEKGTVPSYRISPIPPDTASGNKKIQGVTAWVAIRRRSFWANSYKALRQHPSWRGRWDPSQYGDKKAAAHGFRSMYATPLVWNNEVLGVLKVENPRKAKSFSLNDRRKCDLMANNIPLLLALNKQLRLQYIPSLTHNLQAPASSLVMNLGELAAELRTTRNHESIDALMGMIGRLALTVLTLSRTLVGEIDARVGHQVARDVDLVPFFREQIDLVQAIAPNGIRLDLKLEGGPFVLKLKPIERTWLVIIAFNLLHNALRYSPHDDVVELRCVRAVDSHMTISVADHGSGVPPERRKLIFEPGVTTRLPGWPSGTGLGLFEVSRLLKQLGWTIGVHDNEPQGAVFTITVVERRR